MQRRVRAGVARFGIGAVSLIGAALGTPSPAAAEAWAPAVRPIPVVTWYCDPAGRCRRTPAEGYLLRPNYDPDCGFASPDRREYCASRGIKPQPAPRIDVPRHPSLEPPSIIDPHRPGRIPIQPPTIRVQ